VLVGLHGAVLNICNRLDNEFISRHSDEVYDYTASTATIALFWKDYVTIAHLGDSRACLAHVAGGRLSAQWLTIDHKPDMPAEAERIAQSGGKLLFMDGNKPYLR